MRAKRAANLAESMKTRGFAVPARTPQLRFGACKFWDCCYAGLSAAWQIAARTRGVAARHALGELVADSHLIVARRC